jgi:hypothetical protein
LLDFAAFLAGLLADHKSAHRAQGLAARVGLSDVVGFLTVNPVINQDVECTLGLLHRIPSQA